MDAPGRAVRFGELGRRAHSGEEQFERDAGFGQSWGGGAPPSLPSCPQEPAFSGWGGVRERGCSDQSWVGGTPGARFRERAKGARRERAILF